MMKTLKRKIVYQNPWIRVWEDEVKFKNGQQGIYAFVERVDWGPMIIPMTEKGEIIILREWRYPVRAWTWSFPFGGREPHESVLAAAQRELKEETGIVARRWTKLGELMMDVGGSSQIVPVYLAEQLTCGRATLDHGEEHRTHQFSLPQIEKLLAKSKRQASVFLAGLYLLQAHLARRKKSGRR